MKKIFILFIATVLTIAVKAQEISGTQITSPIVPNDLQDDYPTHIDSLGFGGYRVLPDIISRDNIKPSRKTRGMVVYTLSDSTLYRLDDVVNNTWTKIISDAHDIDTIPNSVTIKGALDIVSNPPDYNPEILFGIKNSDEYQRFFVSKNGLLLSGRLHQNPINVDGLYIMGSGNYLNGINSSSAGFNVSNDADTTQAYGNYLNTAGKDNSLLIGTGKSSLQPLSLDRSNSVQIGANSTTPNIILTEDTTRLYGVNLFNDSSLKQIVEKYGSGGIESGEFSEDIEIISYNDATYRIVSDIPIYDNERVLEVNDTSAFMGAVSKGTDFAATSYINVYPHAPGTFSSQEGDNKGITFYDSRAADLGSGPEMVETKAVFNWQGFKYLNFNESTWTDSTLVPKKYVDDAISGSSSSYTFTDGLTESGGLVKLGGTLSDDEYFTLTGTSAGVQNAIMQFGSYSKGYTPNITFTSSNSSDEGTTIMELSTSGFQLNKNSNDVDNTQGMYAGFLAGSIDLQVRDTADYMARMFINADNGIFIEDNIDTAGMYYKAPNYSINGIAKYGDQWIPDLATVRSVISDTAAVLRSELGGSTTETDPVYLASPAANINSVDYTNISNLSGINSGDQDLSALATKANVLELDNTTTFTPDADYEPATKKYVDDAISASGSSISGLNNEILLSDGSGGTKTDSYFNYVSNRLRISSSSYNTIIGDANTGAGTGTNTIIGAGTATVLSSGLANVIIGRSAANTLSSGDGNVFIGYDAGRYITSGSDNIIIGNLASPSSGSYSDLLWIENSASTTPLVGGNFSTRQIELNGGLFHNITTINAATYDLLTSDYILHVTYTTTGAVTSLTLPTAQTVEGRVIIIKDAGGNAGTNNITIDTEGSETIDGQITKVLNGNYESLKLYCDGSNWFIIN